MAASPKRKSHEGREEIMALLPLVQTLDIINGETNPLSRLLSFPLHAFRFSSLSPFSHSLVLDIFFHSCINVFIHPSTLSLVLAIFHF